VWHAFYNKPLIINQKLETGNWSITSISNLYFQLLTSDLWLMAYCRMAMRKILDYDWLISCGFPLTTLLSRFYISCKLIASLLRQPIWTCILKSTRDHELRGIEIIRSSSVSALSYGVRHRHASFTQTGELYQIEVIGNSIRTETIKF